MADGATAGATAAETVVEHVFEDKNVLVDVKEAAESFEIGGIRLLKADLARVLPYRTMDIATFADFCMGIHAHAMLDRYIKDSPDEDRAFLRQRIASACRAIIKNLKLEDNERAVNFINCVGRYGTAAVGVKTPAGHALDSRLPGL